MSVAAFTPTSVIARAASRLSIVIQRIDSVMSGGSRRRKVVRLLEARNALTRIPLPIGFVRRSVSPIFAVEFRTILSTATTPVTASPYFGTSSMIVWPPATGNPASRAFSAPPRKISSSTSSGRTSVGNAAIANPKIGVAPIA